jgi:hypothetical protein
MSEMFDCEGKKVYEGELIILIGRPDIFPQEYWAVFDCIQYGVYTQFILKNCTTREIKIVEQKNVKRSY